MRSTTTTAPATAPAPAVPPRLRLRSFLLHYAEMLVAMLVGMQAFGWVEGLFWPGLMDRADVGALVMAGKHKETVQDESQASYEGWCRAAEAKINWHNPIDFVHNVIRGCNPAPGAWTTLNGKNIIK